MYVEDYLELLAGNVPCEHCDRHWFISLANYDYSPVRSMSTTVQMGRGLSDKQRDLALRIILKYKKQFSKHGYDITYLETDPQWRSPLRKVDRSKSVYIEESKICVRFPFNPQMVDFFRRYSRRRELNIESGYVEWSSEKKVWVLDCTEQNIQVVYDTTKNENFDYSAEFKIIAEQISTIRKNSNQYVLVCDIYCERVIIRNANESLQEAFLARATGDITYDIGLAKRLGVSNYSLSALRHLYKLDPLLMKLVAKRVLYFEDSKSIHKISQRLEQLGLLPLGDNSKHARTAFFRETVYGLSGKYLEQRVPLVLYCTHYAPFGVEEPYFLKG